MGTLIQILDGCLINIPPTPPLSLAALLLLIGQLISPWGHSEEQEEHRRNSEEVARQPTGTSMDALFKASTVLVQIMNETSQSC